MKYTTRKTVCQRGFEGFLKKTVNEQKANSAQNAGAHCAPVIRICAKFGFAHLLKKSNQEMSKQKSFQHSRINCGKKPTLQNSVGGGKCRKLSFLPGLGQSPNVFISR